MLRRSPSRTLIASAVLLACLTLAAQSYAQAEVWPGAAAVPGRTADRTWSTLLARAQKILTADSAPSLVRAALEHAGKALVAVHFSAGELSSSRAESIPQPEEGLSNNAAWMRTSRAWAS